MKSTTMRANPLFIRNCGMSNNKWGIPTIKKQTQLIKPIRMIACSDTRTNDANVNRECGVHFFVDDYRFNGIFDKPQRSLARYSQYAFLLSPDYSLYADMPMWRQIESVAKNRWVGVYWQEKGLTVIPTISWSTPSSFDFCFAGVEKYATVAIGTIGCKGNKSGFLRGYDAMLDRLEPTTIICFGTPFEEMSGSIIPIDYLSSRKVVR